MAVERGNVAAIIQHTDGRIVVTEHFRLRAEFGFLHFVSLVQHFGILRRDAAGHISREGVVVHHDKLRIKHRLGVLYVLKDGQHLFVDTDCHTFFLHHQALHQFPLRRINFGNADGAIRIQHFRCRQDGILALGKPADIGRNKATEKENRIFARKAGNEFFGVLLKILLCVHDISSCILYTSSTVLSP